MGRLVEQLLSDGFRCLLVAVFTSGRRDTARAWIVLFDGGREVRRFGPLAVAPFRPAPEVRRMLRSVVIETVSNGIPRCLVAAMGNAAGMLLERSLPDLVGALPVLRFEPVAAALLGLRPRADLDRIAAAAGIPVRETDGCPTPDTFCELFWAVLEEADRRGVPAPADLASLPEARKAAPDFERWDFGPDLLQRAPEEPGVYIMRDNAGSVLYVGSTVNLRRRLAEYFRTQTTLPPKVRELRRRLHSCALRTTGSGLEAILLEARLIRELTPEVNVVRDVHLHYDDDAAVRAIVLPSSATDCVDVFLFRSGRSALQVRVRPKRPPRALLERAVAYLFDVRERPPKGRTVTDWDVPGSELCLRYFHRLRPWLTTMVLDGSPQEAARALAEMVSHVDLEQLRNEPAEYRRAELPDSWVGGPASS